MVSKPSIVRCRVAVGAENGLVRDGACAQQWRRYGEARAMSGMCGRRERNADNDRSILKFVLSSYESRKAGGGRGNCESRDAWAEGQTEEE